ncbi:MAG: hydroxymethylpyrimidine/phosphomethylpyrimidine kinase [Bacteroidota bacterium]
MSYNRPIVLSLAGFDPCGGAGVLADIKTFEQHQCLGMAINTAITRQVEDEFISVEWLSLHTIIDQLKTLTDRYDIHFVKIGIIENLDTLLEVVSYLKQQNKHVAIVWDTVLSASGGFNFIETLDKEKLKALLKNIRLITPNVNEVKKLSGLAHETDAAIDLASYCHVLLKGGHSKENEGVDFLFSGDRVTEIKKQTSKIIYPKHGSGCILSAAITSQLALGNDLETACQKAKQYIETLLNSNSNLLAYHVA